ncbi:hypothetical protein [Paenibacillus sp. LHD-38]|uniref:hypothetical protein n=1 Tax=Paenibacillus sp. LHD-38 TaxID=3072143 RepID=UPI00280FEC88|nr:hypothetical protein [Paenibacillus sp. LHD-38]MDQ8738994.1 hypothetical protein [Paenibacillus sp. LHD-38]
MMNLGISDDLHLFSQELERHLSPLALTTEIKKNTIVPEHCSPEGKPECEQGYALVFDGFDKDTYTAWFRGDDEKCAACPLQGLCEKQFGYSFEENPFFYGPVPQEAYCKRRC